MTNYERFAELIEKSEAIVQSYGYADLEEWQNSAATDAYICDAQSPIKGMEDIVKQGQELLMRNNALYDYVVKKDRSISISQKDIKSTKDFYIAICEWNDRILSDSVRVSVYTTLHNVKAHARNMEKSKSAEQPATVEQPAAAQQPTYVTEGDYVLIYSGFYYGRGNYYRLRYDVFEVVEDRKIKPLFDYRFKKWSAAPISDWIPQGVENVAVYCIPGGLPESYLSERHSHIWSDEGCGSLQWEDKKLEIFLPCDKYDFRGRRLFRKVLCNGNYAIPACFDPKNPLAFGEQKNYIAKQFGGKYYINVPWNQKFSEAYPSCQLKEL